jgi:alkyl hydroperoxide reductase subunit F
LVLAILHADGKGKLPDTGIVDRIQRLNGPIRIRTVMSLECENCPGVVQALNVLATLHPDFHHDTVDGSTISDEVQELGIQGVPSVLVGRQLLHSGRSDLVELLGKLEIHFGTRESSSRDLGEFDVVVLGGGPAGASSAIYTARKGLKTALVTDKLGGQLQVTLGIENMISIPYTEGAKLSAGLAEHLSKYPVQVLEHRRVKSIEDGPLKVLALEGGETLAARAVIVATGAQWRKLEVPGETQYIGSGVAFCAHCDGPFFKEKKVVVVGGGNSGVEAALDLANLASHVTLLERGSALRADATLVAKLQAHSKVEIQTNTSIEEVLGDGSKVVGVKLSDGRELTVDGVFVQIGLIPNSTLVKDLVEVTKYGEIVVDAKGRTSRPGIYAAGDVTTVPFKQIVIAMGDGAKVALTVFEDYMKGESIPVSA